MLKNINIMSRHYGLAIGMKVSYPLICGGSLEGEIIELSCFDNNRACMRLPEGQTVNVVCEWCKIILEK